jgi:uracil phosphoribosyltransferase
MSQQPAAVRVVDHPLLQHHLGRLRDESTSPAEFRSLVNRVAMLLGAAATESLTTGEATVTTPVADGSLISASGSSRFFERDWGSLIR